MRTKGNMLEKEIKIKFGVKIYLYKAPSFPKSNIERLLLTSTPANKIKSPKFCRAKKKTKRENKNKPQGVNPRRK